MNLGIALKLGTKFKLGMTIFEVANIKTETKNEIKSRRGLNKHVVLIMRGMKHFIGISDEDLHAIACSMKVYNLDAGESLIGDLENNYFIVESGEIGLVRLYHMLVKIFLE